MMMCIKFLTIFISFFVLIQAQCNDENNFKYQLKDKNGKLLKKICGVFDLVNYPEAIEYCRSHSMKILTVNSKRIRLALEEVVLSNFKGWNIRFRIDGVRIDGVWKVQNATKNFYTQAKVNWVESHDTPPGDDTMSYTSFSRPFRKWPAVNFYFDGYPEDDKMFLFCEY